MVSGRFELRKDKVPWQTFNIWSAGFLRHEPFKREDQTEPISSCTAIDNGYIHEIMFGEALKDGREISKPLHFTKPVTV
jgi:hypothetical protein